MGFPNQNQPLVIHKPQIFAAFRSLRFLQASFPGEERGVGVAVPQTPRGTGESMAKPKKWIAV
jgi:hypothetical protein